MEVRSLQCFMFSKILQNGPILVMLNELFVNVAHFFFYGTFSVIFKHCGT